MYIVIASPEYETSSFCSRPTPGASSRTVPRGVLVMLIWNDGWPAPVKLGMPMK